MLYSTWTAHNQPATGRSAGPTMLCSLMQSHGAHACMHTTARHGPPHGMMMPGHPPAQEWSCRSVVITQHSTAADGPAVRKRGSSHARSYSAPAATAACSSGPPPNDSVSGIGVPPPLPTGVGPASASGSRNELLRQSGRVSRLTAGCRDSAGATSAGATAVFDDCSLPGPASSEPCVPPSASCPGTAPGGEC